MATSDPLALLKDIHMPPPISWWPPAPGWWMLAIALLVTVLGIISLWYKRRRLPIQIAALYELAELERSYHANKDAAVTMKQLSILMRRCSLAFFHKTDVAGLTGEAWLKFLDDTGGNGQFCSGPGRVLLSAPYSRQVLANIDEILKLCKDWIVQLPTSAQRSSL